jgi:hypothetical protein
VTASDVFKMVRTFAVIGGFIWFLSQGDLSEFEQAFMEELGGNATAAGAAGAAMAGNGTAAAAAVMAPRPPVENEAGLEEFLQ